MADQTSFNEWGILEVMGRLRMAGIISEQTIAGAGMIRIDVPATTNAPAFTRFFSPSSIYSITPTEEGLARTLAENFREVPVNRFELRQLESPQPPLTGIVEDERDEDEDDDEDELPF